ncbi:membrane fusion protein, multidrug efflux system [Chitinophaga jiangningensis]|uniref:Membrane fusion protein, multidrug efflux system n=1 Tax=Chitinophaga jiangningensis TaxID=1419482 RepID=A0A1M6Z3L6_9BACT|nr:HlyD family secretion protein [Chitinophaga jiangningensis]SHL25101.1 membrane fusion protein, multidrug efflux system [Chitinophaga jiangningensis]
MKKKYIVSDRLITRITGWMAGIIVLAMAVWGFQSLRSYYLFEQTNDAQVQEYVNPVISRAGGFIVAVKFEENQLVKKGDTLLVIDNQEYTLEVDQTEAAIRKAQAQLQVLDANIHTLEKTASAAQSRISGAKAKVWKQELEYKRYKEMYDDEAATKQQLEDVQATLDINNSDYKTAEENYGAATAHIQDIYAEKAVVQAEIARLKALRDRRSLDVGYTVIRASYDGRMGRRTVEVGQMIDAGETLAYIVNNETDKWVVANYKETQVEKMRIGDTVNIIADAFPDEQFKGTIISLSPATGSSFSLLPPDNSTGNYVKIVQRVPVRIRVDGKRADIDRLKVGMNVNVYLPKKQHHG